MDSTASNYNPDANTQYQFLTQAQVAQINEAALLGVDILGTLENQGFNTSICPEAVCEFGIDIDLFVDLDDVDNDSQHPGSSGTNNWPLNN